MDCANVALPPINRPSPTEVQKYLDRWQAGNTARLDSALRTLFETMPYNSDMGQVAVKLAALNGLYATNIFAVLQIASHITSLGIDADLAKGVPDPDLVERIACVSIKGKNRRNYSFATKYCSFHRPDLYPIYDALVQKILNTLLRQGETFDTFEPGERWQSDYGLWCRSIDKFRTYFGLQSFSIRDIDKYLWMLAKERQAM